MSVAFNPKTSIARPCNSLSSIILTASSWRSKSGQANRATCACMMHSASFRQHKVLCYLSWTLFTIL